MVQSLTRISLRAFAALQGGLKGWRELGLPVTTKLSSPAELATRFGVKLPT